MTCMRINVLTKTNLLCLIRPAAHLSTSRRVFDVVFRATARLDVSQVYLLVQDLDLNGARRDTVWQRLEREEERDEDQPKKEEK